MAHSASGGNTRFCLKQPEGYDVSYAYTFIVTLPVWEGLHFQGLCANLDYRGSGVVADYYVQDMIVVASANRIDFLGRERAFTRGRQLSNKGKKAPVLDSTIPTPLFFNPIKIPQVGNLAVCAIKTQAVGIVEYLLDGFLPNTYPRGLPEAEQSRVERTSRFPGGTKTLFHRRMADDGQEGGKECVIA